MFSTYKMPTTIFTQFLDISPAGELRCPRWFDQFRRFFKVALFLEMGKRFVTGSILIVILIYIYINTYVYIYRYYAYCVLLS